MPNEQEAVMIMEFVSEENRTKFVEKFTEQEEKAGGSFVYPVDATRGSGVYIGRYGEFKLNKDTGLKIQCLVRGFGESDGEAFASWLMKHKINMFTCNAYWFDSENLGEVNIHLIENDDEKDDPTLEIDYCVFGDRNHDNPGDFVLDHFSQELYDIYFKDYVDSDEESDEELYGEYYAEIEKQKQEKKEDLIIHEAWENYRKPLNGTLNMIDDIIYRVDRLHFS